MIAADGMVSTIDTTYNARFAFGWKILDRYYLGPEVQGFAAGDNYRQFRVGVHVTGLNTNGSSGPARSAGPPTATTATVSTASLGC